MAHDEITSPSNTRIKKAIRIRERKHAENLDLLLVEGQKIIEMALAAGAEIREVFFTNRFAAAQERKELLTLLSEKTAGMYKVADHAFAKLSGTATPQGVAAVVSYPALSLEKLPTAAVPLYVVLDGVRDPGNVGTVIRTADAAGSDAVILLEGTCDALSPKVVRATAGSIFNIPLALASVGQLLEWRKRSGIVIAVASADAAQSVFDTELTGSIAVVFGNEGSGVRKELRDSANLLVKIPLYGKAESLNVASSAAICLYEAVRQRTKSPASKTP
jgi:TrmH family RNA methyltransferase